MDNHIELVFGKETKVFDILDSVHTASNISMHMYRYGLASKGVT